MKRIFSALGFALLFTSLNAQVPAETLYADYQKLDNNSYLKYLKKGAGTTRGEIGGALFIQISFLTEGDSVFIDINKEVNTPSYPFRVDAPRYKDDFISIMNMLHVGDSIKCFMSLDSLKKYYPDEFVFDEPHNSMKYLGMAVRVDSIYTAEKTAALQAKVAQQNAELIRTDSTGLKQFLLDNKLDTKPNLNGIWYKEVKKGRGAPVTNGDSVTVRYTARYANNEYAGDEHGESTLSYLQGSDDMLVGWDIGIVRMQAGGKSIFVIPSELANNDGRIMIFEVEVVSVKHN